MINLFAAVIRADLTELRRSLINTLSGMSTTYLMFLLFFFGARVTAGAALGETLSSLVVAYWVMLLTNVAFQNLGYFITEQAMVGTLEQIYLSPYGFGWIAVAKMVAVFLQNMLLSLPFLLLMLLTTGQRIHFDLVSVLPLVLLCMAQSYGFGLLMAGLVLLHKRVQALYQFVSMLLAVCLVVPLEAWGARLLPLTVAWRLLRRIMADGEGLWDLPAADLGLVFAQSAVYLLIGWAVYVRCERAARRAGSLGQY